MQAKSSQLSVERTRRPHINTLEPAVIGVVLARGWKDFATAPWFGLFLGLLYAFGGWAVLLLAAASGYYFLAYPLAAGFALIAPFVAAGLYDVSRQLEAGQMPGWRQNFCILFGVGVRDLGWMALVTGFTFFIWLDIAFFLYAIFFGLHAQSLADLLSVIMTTWNGQVFFIIGNLVGAAIAFFIFSITVVSFPLLLDRDIDFVTAMITSVRVVRNNPRTMIAWALVIGGLLVVALVTALAGLVVILPVLGHASWHMYRQAVAPE